MSETHTIERPRFTRGDHSAIKQTSVTAKVDKRRRTGPYSRWLTDGGDYSGRSREGRFLNACRKELEDHLGGKANITVAQKILIERICFLRLRAALFDEQFLDAGKPLGELDYRVYMAISNSLVRATRELGLSKHSNGSSTPYEITDILTQMHRPQ